MGRNATPRQLAPYSIQMVNKFYDFSREPQAIPLQHKNLREISGMAASIRYNNILYLHEDNGHTNSVYLTNNKGEDLGRLTILHACNRDWEDIAIGPGPVANQDYIYVADIGDNNAWHSKIHIYRFPEPDLKTVSFPLRKTIKDVAAITLQYPDRAHNAEAILLDPFTRDVYIATKEDDSSRIYVARYPQSTRHKIALEPVITLPFRLVTSGNIAGNGLEILLRSEDYYWHWKRAKGETVTAALRRPPEQITPVTHEPQGEAICFAAHQQGYFTCSEVNRKQQPVIYFYERDPGEMDSLKRVAARRE
jgi:hypothetical protein